MSLGNKNEIFDCPWHLELDKSDIIQLEKTLFGMDDYQSVNFPLHQYMTVLGNSHINCDVISGFIFEDVPIYTH